MKKIFSNILFNASFMTYIAGLLIVMLGKLTGNIQETIIAYTWGVIWFYCANRVSKGKIGD